MVAIDVAQNKLRPSLAAITIEAMRPTGVSLYIHGAPGIAKSAVARQVADKLGIAYIDVRLSQMAPEDVRGVPMLGEIDGMQGMIWQPPLVFPRDLDYQKTELVEGRKTIRFFNPLGNNRIHYCATPRIEVVPIESSHTVHLSDQSWDRFTVALTDRANKPVNGQVAWTVKGLVQAIFAFEELNSAPPSVLAASYQLILDRRLGDYLVPDGVMILAMGNRDSDRGVTFRLPKPLANRFVHIEMVEHVDDWLNWSVTAGIHPDVVGFLAKWPSKLLDFNPDSPLHSFASPRSWEFVSKVVNQEAPQEVKRAMICGAIGTAIGTEFILHREYMADMPDVLGILEGTIKSFKPKNKQHAVQIAYSTAVQLLYRLKELHDALKKKDTHRKEWREMADRAIGYMMDWFPPEVTVMALRMGMTVHGLRFSSDMPRYFQFTQINRDLFF